MAQCSLLRLGTSPEERAQFSFEHAMAHRAVLGAVPNLAGLSVLPYFIAEMDFGRTKSLLNHQQAQNDALAQLPWFFEGLLPPVVGVPLNQNMIDTVRNLNWWIFANHQMHLASAAALPTLLGPYPFW